MIQLDRPWRKKLYELWKEFLALSLSDVVMAFGDPMVVATLAHLPHGQVNIAAFGVAKSSAVVFESPIIMILHASNVLSKNKESRRALWKFTLLLSAFMSACLCLATIPFIFSRLAPLLLGISGELAERTHTMLSIVILWPFAIGWRRFFQGMLIRIGRAKLVGRASLGRLFFVGVALAIGFWRGWPGEIVAASALIGGIIAEAVLVTLFATQLDLFEHDEVKSDKPHPKTMKSIWNFYWPLANSALVVWGGRALLLAIIARAVDGSVALASWTAGWGMVLVIGNATRMVQQIIICRRNTVPDTKLLFFACSVGFVFSGILMAIGLTSLGEKVLEVFLGSDQVLITRVMPVLAICSLIPIGIALQNAIQGFLIGDGHTKQVNFATWIGFVAVLSCAGFLVTQGLPGATAAAISMIVAFSIELVYLGVKVRYIFR